MLELVLCVIIVHVDCSGLSAIVIMIVFIVIVSVIVIIIRPLKHWCRRSGDAFMPS